LDVISLVIAFLLSAIGWISLHGEKFVKISKASTEWRRRSCCPATDDKCGTAQSVRPECNVQRQSRRRHGIALRLSAKYEVINQVRFDFISRVLSINVSVIVSRLQWLKWFCEAGGGLPTPLIWRYLGIKYNTL